MSIDLKSLGALEVPYRITELATGKATETVTTPGMWVAADDWSDRERAKGGHSDGWHLRNFGWAMEALACRGAGLMSFSELDMDVLAECQNRFAVEEIRPPEDAGGEVENPTEAPAEA